VLRIAHARPKLDELTPNAFMVARHVPRRVHPNLRDCAEKLLLSRGLTRDDGALEFAQILVHAPDSREGPESAQMRTGAPVTSDKMRLSQEAPMGKKKRPANASKLDTLEKVRRSGLQDIEGDTLDLANAVRALKGKPPLKPLRSRSR
jgi:hypothetical protein